MVKCFRKHKRKLLNDCYTLVSELIFKTTHGKWLILTPKQILQGLPIALAQAKAGNTSKSC